MKTRKGQRRRQTTKATSANKPETKQAKANTTRTTTNRRQAKKS
jgi:hypothetical protein